MQSLGVGFLGAFERGRGVRLLGLLFRGLRCGAVLAAGAGVAVCANAELISNRDAKAVAAAREEIVIMGAPRVEEARNVAPRC